MIHAELVALLAHVAEAMDSEEDGVTEDKMHTVTIENIKAERLYSLSYLSFSSSNKISAVSHAYQSVIFTSS
jgi:hypothetical protein